MKQVVIEVEEVVKFQREIRIDVPDNVTEEEFDKVLSKVERMYQLSASDIPLVISSNIPGTVQYANDLEDFSSPSSTEIEIESVDFDV